MIVKTSVSSPDGSWRYFFTTDLFVSTDGRSITREEICELLASIDRFCRVFGLLPGQDSISSFSEISCPYINSYGIYDTERAKRYAYKQEVQIGTEVYTDRPYLATFIPDYLKGKPFLSPPNDSKHYRGKILLVLRMAVAGRLYLAIEPRSDMPFPPKWVRDEGWRGINRSGRDEIEVDINGTPTSFELFSKEVRPEMLVELEKIYPAPNMWLLIFDMEP